MNRSWLFIFAVLVVVFSHSQPALSWGKWGHFIVGSSAAKVLSGNGFEQMREHSFDLGYYNNVPDIVWKHPETYKEEFPQHFIDLEIFRREMGKNPVWLEDRQEFFKKYPTIDAKAGRNYWRVLELNRNLQELAQKMQDLHKPGKNNREKYQEYQIQWLSTAGTLGHYVADLSQPLHCTENYDGALTGQKGVHAFFEEVVVGEIYPELDLAVNRRVQQKWTEFKKQKKNLTVFELLRELCENSNAEVKKLLAMDKKIDRKNIRRAATKYKSFLVDRLALGSLYLAEIWRRNLTWQYEGERFFLFDAKPAFISPAKEN